MGDSTIKGHNPTVQQAQTAATVARTLTTAAVAPTLLPAEIAIEAAVDNTRIAKAGVALAVASFAEPVHAAAEATKRLPISALIGVGMISPAAAATAVLAPHFNAMRASTAVGMAMGAMAGGMLATMGAAELSRQAKAAQAVHGQAVKVGH